MIFLQVCQYFADFKSFFYPSLKELKEMSKKWLFQFSVVGYRKLIGTACNLMKGVLYYVGNSIRAWVLSCHNFAANLRTLNVNVNVNVL